MCVCINETIEPLPTIKITGANNTFYAAYSVQDIKEFSTILAVLFLLDPTFSSVKSDENLAYSR